MNFNASRNVGQAGGLRKAKRVSDVNAMGAPSPAPAFSPAPAPYPQHYPPAGPPPPYSEGIQLDTQDYSNNAPAGNFGFMNYPQAPQQAAAHLGSMLQQPVVQDMALQYGNQLAAAGARELTRLVPVSRLRYYFAVDSRYVLSKLLLIIFPYTHKEWMVKYDQNTPVQPRDDINAPDLYIPCMGYVTYVLLAGFMLGLQHRFSPEQISIQASSALAYIIFEMVIYVCTLYITSTGTQLGTLDLLAFSGYKYTAMIASLLAALLLGRTGYYCTLVYTSIALSYFLVKTLRLQLLSGGSGGAGGVAGGGGVQPGPAPYGYSNPYAEQWNKPAQGTKRRVYFLLFVALTQPLLVWWLTYHLAPAAAVAPVAAAASVSPAR